MASIVIGMSCIAIFNIFNTAFHQWSLKMNHKMTSTRREESANPDDQMISNITYYNLANDERYDYEFRFEFSHSIISTNSPRLMILLNGSKRTCADYWDFPVGRRILTMIRNFRFLVLAICSKRRKFDRDDSIEENLDVKWIYYSLQKWMNEIYFKQFQQYPRLYVHGISRGSTIAALLSRILPIQGQILTLFPGDLQGFIVYSNHSTDLQTRLQLDPIFANWFYFDFCYNKKSNTKNMKFCPFENNGHNYQPIPPTYFIHSVNDELFNLTDYIALVDRIRRDSFNLGGVLLNDAESVKFHILSPAPISLTYMTDMFDPWHSKLHASTIFYEHFTNRHLYKTEDPSKQTCVCLPVDFTYFEQYPNITKKWSWDIQNKYSDYVNDIKKYQISFCEEICGDLYTDHAMSSRHLDKALEWTNRIDSRRHTHYVKDYLTRSLRIWMYDKNSIMTKTNYFSSNIPNYVNISKSYQSYSPEYYLQEYFQQLQGSTVTSRHKLQWADNPLLADYFIIPSDLTYYYFYGDNNNNSMYQVESENRIHKLNIDYFDTLLNNIRTNFPYWTMVDKADNMGSNHILTILHDKNMGILYNSTQTILKNVIQIVFTGIRDDMSNSNIDTSIVYRHHYDVVIPQFTRLEPKNNPFENIDRLVDEKTCLFFFAGSLNHIITNQSAWIDMKNENKIKIGGKQYQTIKIIEDLKENADYIALIQSSVFTLSRSTRIYDAIQIGSIPTILSDKIVLPFERFIDWTLFSTKININKIRNMTDFISRLDNFERYVKQKLNNALQYKNAFRWPYSDVEEDGKTKHEFLSDEDQYGLVKNVFHYISLELRCRRLEQFYGLNVNDFSKKSKVAQEKVCKDYPNICPCHNAQQPVAFQEFI
jgi:hypothetical protein